MREQHLDLLALLAGDEPLVLLGKSSGQVPRAFVERAHHLAHRLTRAALRLERTCRAVRHAGAVAEEAVGRHLAGAVREATPPALEQLAGGTGIGVLADIEGEVGA